MDKYVDIPTPSAGRNMLQDYDTGHGYAKGLQFLLLVDKLRGTHEASVSSTLFMRDTHARETA